MTPTLLFNPFNYIVLRRLALFIGLVAFASCAKDDAGAPLEHIPTARETQILSWLQQQQLANGLLESTENNNTVSLYDQSLAAMTFMLHNEVDRAEMIFDFFNDCRESELNQGVGGFSQFRDRNGIPGGHRWMGDNAWLLIALNNHKALTGRSEYDALRADLSTWLQALQDTSDGGLWAGYNAQNQRLSYKVTEGNIDAFNAISGYTPFHQELLHFLEIHRWNLEDQTLLAWPENPPYAYAVDCTSWAYCLFPNYPHSSLGAAQRFLNTQTSTLTGNSIEGYDIDEDRDAIFMEGTGQMALAWKLSGNSFQYERFIAELDKGFVLSTAHPESGGFPYASNPGTAYGSDPYWNGADTEIAVSPGAWYLFALRGYNPFGVERQKNMPDGEQFWRND